MYEAFDFGEVLGEAGCASVAAVSGVESVVAEDAAGCPFAGCHWLSSRVRGVVLISGGMVCSVSGSVLFCSVVVT